MNKPQKIKNILSKEFGLNIEENEYTVFYADENEEELLEFVVQGLPLSFNLDEKENLIISSGTCDKQKSYTKGSEGYTALAGVIDIFLL